LKQTRSKIATKRFYSCVSVSEEHTASIFRFEEAEGFACCLLLADYSLDLLFNPEDGGSMFLRNVSEHLPDYTASHPRR
jgi:hypothetical protein